MKTKARRRAALTESAAGSSPSPRVLSVQWREPAISFALVILTLLAFSNSFDAGFTLDNKGLLHDPRITQWTAHNIDLILHHTYWWPNGEAGLYRPLTTLSYLFNDAILGDGERPFEYHAINFFLHAFNVLLVYALLLRLAGQQLVAASIAAAWAVHPLLTESVTNIVGRADLLAGLATLGGLLLYMEAADAAGARRAAWFAGLMAIAFAGVFSKESAVCVIVLIVLYEVILHKERVRTGALVAGCAATAIPIGVMLYARSKVLAASLPAEFPFTDNPIVGASFRIGKLTALKVIARYLGLILWPAKLSSDYSYPEIPLFRGALADWFCVAVVLGTLAGAARLYKTNKLAFFLLCFAGATFFPMSNLVLPIGTIMAERFMYLPAIGLLACVVLAIYGACERLSIQRFGPVIVCVMIACFAIRTWARNADWADERSIVTASLDASPDSFKLHRQLATLLYGQERTPENIQRGKEEAEKSVALLDALPDAQNTAEPFCLAGGYNFIEGELLNQSQDSSAILSPQADASYRRGISLVERCARIDKNVHDAYAAKLRGASDARPFLEGDPQPYLMLSVAYSRLNDPDKAINAAREALRLHPRSSNGYLQVANIFMRKNLRADATGALVEGLLLTSGGGLAEALATLYKDGADAGSCQMIATPSGPSIDPHCAPFRERVCAISADVLKVRLASSRRDLAEQQRLDFMRNYGCPTGPLDAVFSGLR